MTDTAMTARENCINLLVEYGYITRESESDFDEIMLIALVRLINESVVANRRMIMLENDNFNMNALLDRNGVYMGEGRTH